MTKFHVPLFNKPTIEKLSKVRKVQRTGKYGFINEQGEEIIECKFDYIGPFKNGRAIVKLGGKLEIIDTEGTVITEGNHGSAQ